MLRLSREGQAALLDPVPGMAERPCLHIAVVIPPFARGSGGHGSIFQIVRGLERMGHTCSIWLHDPLGHSWERPAVLRRRIVEEFLPLDAPVFKGFDDWFGADVVVATGWETVFPAVLLPDCHARVYLIHDHEPEFFAMSAEHLWAEQTYGFDLYPISASTWLRDMMRDQLRARRLVVPLRGRSRRLPPAQGRAAPGHRDVLRPPRDAAARRAAGDARPRRAAPPPPGRSDRPVRRHGAHPTRPSPTSSSGVVSPEVLAWRYSEATVGVCLSLTNYSLIPQEMMACGLPCVDLAGRSPEAVFGPDGPVELAEPDPLAIADAVEALLDDEERWARRSNAGLAFVEGATWERAAQQVEKGLRAALRERECLVRRPRA